MADYTDGLGWAKLDATAACHLGRIIENFSDKTRGARATMLLFCYSQLRGDKLPTFKLGLRTISKACGLTDRQAQRFMEYCEECEYIVQVDETPEGKTPKRTFWWFAEGCNQIRLQGVTKHPVKVVQGCNQTQGEKVTLQTTESKRDSLKNLSLTPNSSGDEISPRASSVYADAPTDARQKEQTPTDNEIEEKEYGFVDTKDIQPGPDAIGIPQDEFDNAEQEFQKAIDEALAKNSFTGANKADFAWRDYRRAHKPISGDA